MADGNEIADDLHGVFHKLFGEFANFGETSKGGISRLAASPADGQARDHLCAWLEGNNFEITVDSVGNIFGTLDLERGDPEQHFLCGSHLDSQPHGGRFDGTLGVVYACLAALVIKGLAEEGKVSPACGRFVVVCWTGEEGARFQPSLLGSGVYSGELLEEAVLSTRDKNDISLRQALSEIGYLGTGGAPHPAHYLEVHIEQGRRLEDTGTSIGVVTSCWGARKLRIEINGRPDHTGPTPMNERKDALCGAAHVVIVTNEISKSAQNPVHSSVGRMTIEPNSPNTVAERVELWVEFRSGDETVLDDVEELFTDHLTQIERDTGCQINVVANEVRAVVEFDDTAAARVEAALSKAKISHMRLPTIAGHDAVRLQAVCPTTLIFVPSQNGVSHAPEEFTSKEDMTVGLDATVYAISELISTPTQAHSRRVHRA